MKKIIAFILSVIMIISLMPMVVFAENSTQELSFDEDNHITTNFSLSEGDKILYSFTPTTDGYYSIAAPSTIRFDVFLDGSEPNEDFEGGTPYETVGGGGGPSSISMGYNFDANTKYYLLIHLFGNNTSASGEIDITRFGDKIIINPPVIQEYELSDITSFSINSSNGDSVDSFAVFKGEQTIEYLQIYANTQFLQMMYPSINIKGYSVLLDVESNKACVSAEINKQTSNLIIKSDKNSTAKTAVLTVKLFLENDDTKEKMLVASKDFNVNITPQEYTNGFEFLTSSESAKSFYSYNETVMVSMDIKAPASISTPSIMLLSEDNRCISAGGIYYSVNQRSYGVNHLECQFQGRFSGNLKIACLPLTMSDGNKICIVNDKIEDANTLSTIPNIFPGYKVIYLDLSCVNFTVAHGIEDYNAPTINSIELINADENGKINAQRARFRLDVEDPEDSDMEVSVTASYAPNDIWSGFNCSVFGTAYKGKDGYWYCDIACKKPGNYRVVDIVARDIYENITVITNSKGYDYESLSPEELEMRGLNSRDLSNANFTMELNPDIVLNNVVSYPSINNKNPRLGEQIYYGFHVEAPQGKEITSIQVEKYYGDSYWGDSAWIEDPKSFNADIPANATVGKNGLQNITVWFTDGSSIAYVDENNAEYIPWTADTVIPIDMSNTFAYVETSSDAQGPIFYPETFYVSGKVEEVGASAFFRIKVDDDTGINYSSVSVNSIGDYNTGYITGHYNEQTGYIEGEVKANGVGTIDVVSISVSDVIGNTSTLYNSEYGEYNEELPAVDLSQLAFTIEPFEDNEAPVIDGASISVNEKNVAPHVWDALTINISDDSPLNGRKATIGVKSPRQEWPEYHEIYEKGEGVYSGIFNEMYCGNYQIMYISAKDANGKATTVIDNRYIVYIENLKKEGFGVEGEVSYADLSAGDYRVGMMDENTNVFVSGDNISEGTQIAVSEISNESDAYKTLVGEDTENEVKACFEVSINGEYKSSEQPNEKLLISFMPEGVVAGDIVTIKHLRSSDGQIETTPATVLEDGTVNMMVNEFSPFMVIVDPSQRHTHKYHDGYCELCNEHSSVSHKGIYQGGDVNGDGEINNLDLVRTMKTIIGVDEESFVSRDFNDDGIINAADLVRMVRFMNREDVIVY